jgi:hypothetical protein
MSLQCEAKDCKCPTTNDEMELVDWNVCLMIGSVMERRERREEGVEDGGGVKD